MTQSSDRNLLLGILALQNDLVTRDQLIEAMNAWAVAKDRPLGEILVERKALDQDHRQLLEQLLDAHVRRHGSIEQSLAACEPTSSVRSALEQVADGGVQATLLVLQQPRQPEVTVTSSAARAAESGPRSGAPDTIRYRVLRPHAKGGLGEVFVAEDLELHREVALKEIQQQHADKDTSRGRFVLEAEITGGLEHPGIVPVYGLGTYADGRPFYAMRFIKGDNLKHASDRFHQSGARFDSLEFRQLLGRFVDVCNAVAYAHSRGVLHRDLKPGNIMLGKFGETLVVDWGLAKVVGRAEVSGEEPTLVPASGSGVTETLEGSAIGTPAYMSPEQAAGKVTELGPATDVYSLGATLYAVLTNRPPIVDEDLPEALRRVQSGDLPHPRDVNPSIPKPLEAICLKAMAREPAKRQATALDLAADLERWLADEPVSCYREPTSVRITRWRKRHRTLVTSATVAAFLLLVGAIAGLALLAELRAERKRTLDKMLDIAWTMPEQGRVAEGMLRLAGCLELVPQKDIVLEDAIRANLAAWYGELHPIEFVLSDVGQGSTFIRGGAEILVCLSNGSIQSWSTDTWAPVGKPLAKQENRSIIAVSSDGKQFLTANRDEPMAQLWDVESMMPSGRPLPHESAIGCAAFSGDGSLVITGSHTKARVWDTRTQELVGEPLEHEKNLTAVAFSPDGSRFATADMRAMYVWDAKTLKCLGEPTSVAETIYCLAFSPDGSQIAMGSQSETVRFCDANTLEPLGHVLMHPEPVHSVDFSLDGTEIVTGCRDGIVRRWNVGTGDTIGAPMMTRSIPDRVTYSPSRPFVLAVGSDQVMRVWRIHTPRCRGPLRHAGAVRGLSFSPDGRTAVTACSDGTFQEWDLATLQRCGLKIDQSPERGFAVTYSPDGERICTCASRFVRQWDRQTGQQIGSDMKLKVAGADIMYCCGGDLLFGVDDSAVARLWNDKDNALLHSFPTAAAIAVDQAGDRLFTSSRDTADPTVRVWSAHTCSEVLPGITHEDTPWAVACRPDGGQFLTGTTTGVIQLWDGATGEALTPPIVGHASSIRRAVYCADGTRYATASHDRTVRIWHSDTGRALGPALKHSGPVKSVAISPDGKTLLSGDGDGEVWLWELPPQTVHGDVEHLAPWANCVTGVQLQADGRVHILSASEWNEIREQLNSAGDPMLQSADTTASDARSAKR